MASHLGAAQGTLTGLGQEGSFRSDFLHRLEKPAWCPRQTLNLRTINENSSSRSQCYLQRRETALSPFWDVLGFQSVSNHTELADHVTDIYHSKVFPFLK